MAASVLDRVLVVDRERPIASKYGGFSEPVIHERAVDADSGPFVVTTTKGPFVTTRVRKEGVVWSGFTECPVRDEGRLIKSLYKHLHAQAWDNKRPSVSESVDLVSMRGLEAKALIVSSSILSDACGRSVSDDEAEKLMWSQGHIAEVNGLQVYLCSDLDPGTGLVLAAPLLTGVYVRSAYSLAVMLYRADTAVALVTP